MNCFTSEHLIVNEFCYLLNHLVDQDEPMKRKEVIFSFHHKILSDILTTTDHRITASKSFDNGLDDNNLDDSKIGSALKYNYFNIISFYFYNFNYH